MHSESLEQISLYKVKWVPRDVSICDLGSILS